MIADEQLQDTPVYLHACESDCLSVNQSIVDTNGLPFYLSIYE